jgi:hypothetical protein
MGALKGVMQIRMALELLDTSQLLVKNVFWKQASQQVLVQKVAQAQRGLAQ